MTVPRRAAVMMLLALASLHLAAAESGGHSPSTAADQPAGFATRPYVTAPGRSEMSIAWTSPAAGEFTVRFGRDRSLDRALKVGPLPDAVEYADRPTTGPAEPPAATQPEPNKRVEHCYLARLTDLSPGAEWRYEVSGGGQTAGGTFRTLPGAGGEFTFIAYGDSQNPERHAQVAAGFGPFKPRLILHVGDMVNRGEYWPNYRTDFFEPLGGLAAGVPIMPALGNHDSGQSLRRLFPHGEGRLYYSFDCGDAHFVCLDSFIGKQGREPMLQWAERDLAASKARWKIVYGHLPSYDVGAHGTGWGRTDFLPLFRKHGVDLAFAGHTHTYQRFRPMFTRGENESRPITYLVTGGGGGDVHRVSQDPYLAAGASEHHFVVVTVSAGKLSGRSVSVDGKELDAFEIVKDAEGQPDATWLAQAVAEEDFGVLRALVWPSVKGLTLSDDPRTGRPARVKLDMGAGDRALAFTLRLEKRAAEAFAMQPVSGRSTAGQTTPVEVEIRLRDPARFADPQALLPVLRLECLFEIDGQKGSVFSSRLDWRNAATNPDSPAP